LIAEEMHHKTAEDQRDLTKVKEQEIWWHMAFIEFEEEQKKMAAGFWAQYLTTTTNDLQYPPGSLEANLKQ
jgi:hypothetical protein